MSKQILVVDDEAQLVRVLRGYLEEAGYGVVTASNGRQALFAVRDHNPDLIILDLMMPEVDGWEFLRQLRRENDVPVIMLTARVEDIDKITGLELGADDYVTKPFSPRELLARVRAVMRRSSQDVVTSNLIRAGDLEVDPDARLLRKSGNYLELTKMEFDLLVTLMSNPGRAYNRLELLERTQGFAYDGYERSIDVHVKNLRKKIENDSANPEYILTAFGIGYRFNPEL